MTILILILAFLTIKWITVWFAKGHLLTKARPTFKEVFSYNVPDPFLNLGLLGLTFILAAPAHKSYEIFFFGFFIAAIALFMGKPSTSD